jgi:hypothetical protein
LHIKRLKQSVNKRRDRGSAGKHHQGAEDQDDHNQGQQPELLPLIQKTPQILQEIHIRFLLSEKRVSATAANEVVVGISLAV